MGGLTAFVRVRGREREIRRMDGCLNKMGMREREKTHTHTLYREPCKQPTNRPNTTTRSKKKTEKEGGGKRTGCV